MKELMFVIPFAGGSSNSFLGWETDEDIECVFIDTPGKGMNSQLPFLDSMSSMVDFCESLIDEYLERRKTDRYYLFGHSMGSYLAYETALNMQKHHKAKPNMLIMSGTTAPDTFRKDEIIEAIKDDESFINYIKDFNMLNENVINSRFFKDRYLKVIKNDYSAILSYKNDYGFLEGVETYIINGKNDIYSEKEVMGWSDYFERLPKYKWICGDHFSILKNFSLIAEIVGNKNDL